MSGATRHCLNMAAYRCIFQSKGELDMKQRNPIEDAILYLHERASKACDNKEIHSVAFYVKEATRLEGLLRRCQADEARERE